MVISRGGEICGAMSADTYILAAPLERISTAVVSCHSQHPAVGRAGQLQSQDVHPTTM